MSLIRESGSTARVLNLPLVFERFGGAEEYTSAPLFQSQVLNKALLLKHVVRPHERCLFCIAPASTTKIIVPFDPADLRLGGRTILVGESNFPRELKAVGRYAQDEALRADTELIELLDSLPSFDPFLMRERLRQSGRNPARCYFDLSQADIARMREFVAREIEQLVSLAYVNGGASARELSTKLADKLMTDETAKALDPLRTTLRLSEDEYREGVFAWKGFLYYEWLHRELQPRLAGLTADLRSLRLIGGGREARWQIDDVSQRLVEFLDLAAKGVRGALLAYANSFGALTRGQSSDFRDFLLNAPKMFVTIGEALGAIMHIESFWRFRFPPGSALTMQADEAFDMYGDFEGTLGGAKIVADAVTFGGDASPYSAIRSRLSRSA
ncbi:MAG: hypothetical protein JNJ73_03515 [Hyphomonadaceae bacterium]|nr:hypothetical protein [Hyphomonadaceae bacterium]